MKTFRRIVLLAGVVALLAWLFLPTPGTQVAQGSILVLTLSGEYVESPQPPLVSRLLGDPARPFAGLLSELTKAERDDRLAAVVFRIRGLSVGWAKAQEIRDAIARLEASGRPTVALLEVASFGANLEYYVASAAGKVYVQPAARVPLVGLAGEYLFLGGFWDLFGVEIEVEKIGRYKSAADTFAGRSMSDANREMAESLLDSIDAQFVAGIAESRTLPEDAVRAAIDATPIEPDEMARFGLVDGTRFLDEVVGELGGGPVVRGREYAQVDPAGVGFEPVARFALVYGSGGVVTGEGTVSPGGGPVLASDTVGKALRDAADDPTIDAVIFRIDSPGGSPLASDIVWRASEYVRARGKPLVASFSDVAASGGYYVAAGADAIVASPGSITGSIGVFVLRPVLAGLLEKLDIGVESLTRGAHADLQLSSRPLSPGSRERLRAEVRSIYDLFVERVAAGRGLERDAVDAVARGRVWTGAQAAERGLVDALGGLRAAVLEGKARAGIDADADVALVDFPPARSVFEQIDALLRGAVRLSARSLVSAELRRLEPWFVAASDGGPVVLLPFAPYIR